MLATASQSDLCFPDRVRLPLAFDPARLQADLAGLGGQGGGPTWTQHFVPQNFAGDWSVIPLRFHKGAVALHPILQIISPPTATQFEDAPALARTPYLRAVLARFACEVQTARLMKLTPGSIIKLHRDDDLAAEWDMARIHIPVVTNDAVDFRLNGTPVAMAAGSAWYLRLSDPHSVANRGTTDRVHLVVDCVVNDWLRVLLAG